MMLSGEGQLPGRDCRLQPNDTITLCVSGQIFITRVSTLFRLPSSRLYLLASRQRQSAAEVDDDPEPTWPARRVSSPAWAARPRHASYSDAPARSDYADEDGTSDRIALPRQADGTNLAPIGIEATGSTEPRKGQAYRQLKDHMIGLPVDPFCPASQLVNHITLTAATNTTANSSNNFSINADASPTTSVENTLQTLGHKSSLLQSSLDLRTHEEVPGLLRQRKLSHQEDMTKADGNQTVHLQKTSSAGQSAVSVLRDKPMLSGGLMCHLGTEAQSGEIPGLRQNVELAGDRAGKTSTPVFFFDRDPEIFRFVLDYYRTGELHLPTNICGPFARKELIYWGVDESFILPCCMPAYMRYEEERRIKKTLFRDCFEDIDSIKNLVKCCRGWKRWKYQIWLFLDHPSSSLAAKVSCILSSGYGKDFAQQTLSWNSVASEIALS